MKQIFKKLILASQSPRRSEILKKAGYQFASLPSHVSEIPDKNLNLDDQIIDIARRKAWACFEQNPGLSLDSLILAADTVVCIGSELLGKPESQEEALKTLRRLSGQTHLVKTALVILEVESKKLISHIETTEIKFKHLSDMEIRSYVETGDPLDKAGSYGIQSGAGPFVEKIQGEFDNVVGLPLRALENLFMINLWAIARN